MKKVIGMFSGVLIDPARLKTNEVHIDDIVHNLSMQTRFNGSTFKPYYGAQHAVALSYLVDQNDYAMCLTALMFNAHTAYLGDIVTPLKKTLKNYRELESVVSMRIGEALNYNPTYKYKEIFDLKNALTRYEIEVLTNFDKKACEHLPSLKNNPVPLYWSWQECKTIFYNRYIELKELTKKEK